MPGVDLHCHILPGVDDGPDTLEESLAYARAAVAAGTETIVATPHVELVDVSELPDRVAELQGALAAEGIPLRVEVGGELKPESLDLSGGELEVIAHGPPDARWLLYEVPFRGVDEEFLAGARDLRERGFALLLAHPERSRRILEDGLDALDPLVRSGARVAMNVGPLTGREGEGRHVAALELVRRGLVDVVATDAHPPRRPYQLAEGAAVLGDPARGAAATQARPAAFLAEGLGP